jgi:hypothetical protein
MTSGSGLLCLVIPTNEELMIAKNISYPVFGIVAMEKIIPVTPDRPFASIENWDGAVEIRECPPAATLSAV